MDLNTITYLVVGATFALYIGIAIWARAGSTGEFYVAGKGVHPVANGMATAADCMSAASFISMAGLIAFNGYGASVFLMGWTGGYVLLALLLAPYLRKFGKFTVPEFIGDRYYSQTARIVAVICLILASITYVIGQMKGIGVAFSRFLQTDYDTGLYIGMGIVFIYAVMGGMKGITYTQIAQYVVLIFAYTVPAIFISMNITGNPIPQLGLSNTARTGLTGFVAGTARQVAEKGVTINNLLPGIHATDRAIALDSGVSKAKGISMEEAKAQRELTIPTRRYGTASEFGAACAFLCSRHAAYITAQNILMDGGLYPGTL